MDHDLLDGFYLRDIRIEPSTGKVYGPEGVRHLTSMSLEVLLYLAKRPRLIVPRERILEKVWEQETGSAEALTHAIGEVRRTLGDHPDDPQFIQSVPARGYRLLVTPRPFTELTNRDDNAWQEPPFLSALIRHGVVQAVFAYVFIGWVLIQIAGETFTDLGLPDWSVPFVIYVVIIGIPIVGLLSWSLEVAGGRVLSDRGEQSGGLLSGLSRNYFAVIAAYGIASIGVGIYQATVGIGAEQFSPEQLRPTAPGDPYDPVPIASNSVAVLRLVNLDGSERTGVFSNGLSEDILDRVARVPGLLVPSRGDTLSLPDNAPSELVRRRLRVAYYLEGTVRIAGDFIVVVAQLIDSRNGYQIFSRPFEVKLANFRDIQKQITGLVVSQMRVSLPEDLQESIAPPKGESRVDAYIQYRLGKDIMDQPHTAESIESAADYFQRALEIDPGYAAAHAGLCVAFMARYQLEGTTSDIESAEQSCGAALAAAPRLPLVHRARGSLHYLTSQLNAAEASYLQALAFNQQDAEAMLGLARVYQRQRRGEAAEELILRAIELQPGNWIAYNALGAMQFDRGQYTDAADTYRTALYLQPDNFIAIGNMATAKMMAGDFEGARDAFERSLKIEKDPRFLSNLGIIHYYLGEFEEAVKIHQQDVELSPNIEAAWINLADSLYFAGRMDEAAIAFRKGAVIARERFNTDPTNVETLTYLAWAETMVGNSEEGVALSERAIELAPDNPFSYYYRALIALRANDRETAVDAAKKAVDLGYPRIMLNAEPYLKSLGKRL